MSAKKSAEALIRAGETRAPESSHRLWWQQTDAYWELPLFAEMDMCCSGLIDKDSNMDDWQAAREQLWAMRELDEKSGDFTDDTLFLDCNMDMYHYSTLNNKPTEKTK